MDKIVLNVRDVETLLKWRDEHATLVRSMPPVKKAIEISFSHNDLRIIGVRKGNVLKLNLHQCYTSLGGVELEIDGSLLRKRKDNMKVEEEDIESVITLYSSLMAFMSSSPAIVSCKEAAEKAEKVTHVLKKPTKKHSKLGITYIIKYENDAPIVSYKGLHAKPKGIFTVRGHYRHYKNGKVVWIDEYRKGTGKKRPKTYKIGGGDNES